MEHFRYMILFLILICSTSIGFLISKKYSDRLKELNNLLELINIIENKIKFTRIPIKDILKEIREIQTSSISELFYKIGIKMNKIRLREALEVSIKEEEKNLNLKKDDFYIIRNIGNILGKTDVEGQVSGFNLIKSELKKQIQDAYEEKRKNEKMYKSLGTIVGLVFVILLI